ncbi:MAG: hypothetical protein AABX10_05485 [Nanoarchaeota archaeon]
MEIYMSIDGNYTSGYLDTFVKDVTSQKDRGGLICLGPVEKLVYVALSPPITVRGSDPHIGLTPFDRCLYVLDRCDGSLGSRTTADIFSLVLGLNSRDLKPMEDALAQFQCLNI